MLEFQNVSFSYEQGNPVLRDVSFRIGKGECVGLIGANGAGKSTVMKLALGLLSGEGRILSGDLLIGKVNLAKIRKQTGFVLQNSDNQMFMPRVSDDMIFGPVNYGMSREEAGKRADEVLGKLNVSYLRDRYNHKISGGEKRLAAIATVLAMEPEILLFDEPSSALDPKNRRMLINILNSLGETKLIASHDLDLVLDTCREVMLLNEGRLCAFGSAKEILTDKALLEANGLELPLRYQN